MPPYYFVGSKDYATGLLDAGSAGFLCLSGGSMSGNLFNTDIGSTARGLTFQMESDTMLLNQFIFHANQVSPNGFNFMRSRGTSALPLPCNSGDRQSFIRFLTYNPDSANYVSPAAYIVTVQKTVNSLSDISMQHEFWATNSSGSTTLRPVVRIGKDGLWIGSVDQAQTNSFSNVLTRDGYVCPPAKTVSALRYTVPAGAMAYVTDATTSSLNGHGLAVVGGGSNKVMTWFDGNSFFIV